MKKLATLLLTGSLVFGLSGCSSYRHHQAGDAASATGDMRSAVYHYERALAHKERYQRDVDFLQKLAIARSQVAYDDAKRLRREGRYEQAVDRLREAMRQDAGFEEPSILLPTVLKEAADWRYGQALMAADGGDLAAAREHLMRSLQHDMGNDSVVEALTSLSPEKLDDATPGLAAYREGVSQTSQRRWVQAEAAYRSSVSLNTSLLPARAGLHEAIQQLTRARHLASEGQSHFNHQSMGPAIHSLNESLGIWPFNEQAESLLSKAKSQQALAESHHIKSAGYAEQAKWDEAIAQADAGLALDRSHEALGRLRWALPRRAAADFSQRGDQLLQQNDLPGAESAYEQALRYHDTSYDARQGLAGVYTAWGMDHERADRPGSALLHYLKARSFLSAEQADDTNVMRVRAALRARLDLGLSIQADEQVRSVIAPEQLRSAVTSTLADRADLALIVREQKPLYQLRMTISAATIREQLTDTSHRNERYTTTEYRRNPEYDSVAAQLRSAERDYDRAIRDYQRAAGHGYGSHHPEHDAHCSHHYNSIQHARSRVDRLARQLARTPHQLRSTLYHDWPYTVETYTKTGELRVHTELVDARKQQVVQSFTHQAGFSQSDSRTIHANPSIGVREDHLALLADGEVAGAMVDEIAAAAGPWVVRAVVDHQMTRAYAQAEVLDAQGKADQALEARVDGAILLGLIDPAGAEVALEKLSR